MRIHITFDSATTAETRSLLAALSRIAGLRDTAMHLNGPEKWAGTTEPMPLEVARRVLVEAEADLDRRTPEHTLDRPRLEITHSLNGRSEGHQ